MSITTNTTAIFSERQRFTQWWLWLILLGTNALLLYGIYKQVVQGEQFGNQPMPDWGLYLVTGFLLVISASIFMFRLDTEIKKEGISVRFFPFHFSMIKYPWDQIEKVYVRQYKPISEYGGWGVRYGFGRSGKAYNVSGNQGLQLVFTDGKKLLIGTQKPDALKTVLMNMGKGES